MWLNLHITFSPAKVRQLFDISKFMRKNDPVTI
nr:MAG TPA: hypothetical protein [Caudoviricetes sp.]